MILPPRVLLPMSKGPDPAQKYSSQALSQGNRGKREFEEAELESQGCGSKGPGLERGQYKIEAGGKADISHKTSLSSFAEVRVLGPCVLT